MIYPKFLKSNDFIGVTAPSDGTSNEIDLSRLENAEKKFKKLGYNIVETKDCKTSKNGRSASRENRGLQFNQLLNDDKIKTIFGLAGGDFILEMLPYVKFELIKNNPKWIQGYSDITGILFPITTICDVATIYGDNFKSFAMKEYHKSLNDNLEILKGNIVKQYSFDKYQNGFANRKIGDESYVLDKDVNWINLKGEDTINIKGRMIGGCLDVILSLIGTKFDNINNFIEKYKNDGIIWYFDCCDVTSEDLTRAMWQFKEAGFFKYTNGIVFGRNAIDKSIYDISFKDAVRTSLSELNIPIIADVDIGHKPPRMTIINGAIANIHSEKGRGSIEFELK